MTSRFFRGLGHLPVEGKEQFSQAAAHLPAREGVVEARNMGILLTAIQTGTPNPYHRHTVKPGSTVESLSPLSPPTLPPRASHSPYLIADLTDICEYI